MSRHGYRSNRRNRNRSVIGSGFIHSPAAGDRHAQVVGPRERNRHRPVARIDEHEPMGVLAPIDLPGFIP